MRSNKFIRERPRKSLAQSKPFCGVLNPPLNDLLPYHPKVRTVWAAQSQNVPLETQLYYHPVAGGPPKHQSYKKRAQLMVYDKRAQQRAMGEDPIFGELPHTRIELSSKAGTKLAKLDTWKPTQLSVWRFFRHPYSSAEDFLNRALLLNSIRVRGLRNISKANVEGPTSIDEMPHYFPDDVIRPEMNVRFGRRSGHSYLPRSACSLVPFRSRIDVR